MCSHEPSAQRPTTCNRCRAEVARIHNTMSCDAAAATTHTYMLANEGDGIGAHVTVGENVLFFRVQAAVESAHAKGVTLQQLEASRC